MNNIKDVFDPVHWYEGMMLSAQHFQQNNLYFERLMAYHDQLHNPYGWGVFHLEIDKMALSRGFLKVDQLIAVLPDGTIARAGSKDIFPNEATTASNTDDFAGGLSLDLNQLNDIQPNDTFYVYVGIPEYTKACASDDETDLKRYESVSVSNVTDNNDIKNQLNIVRLRPRIQLIPEQQFRSNGTYKGNYSGFQLAKIRLDESSRFELQPFLPAVLVLNHDPDRFSFSLTQRVKHTLDLVEAKAKMIYDHIQNKNETESAQGRQNIYHLTAQLPAFKSVFNSDNVSPYALYQAILQVAGHMAVLTDSLLPPPFEQYNHERPLPSFTPILNYIKGICDGIQFDFEDERFEFDKASNTFSAFVKQLIQASKVYVSCTVGPHSDLDGLKSWMENASISSQDTWENNKSRRTLGADRKPITAFKALDLTPGQNELFYEISHDAGELMAQQRLYITNTKNSLETHRPLSIKLIVENKGDTA